MQAIYHTRRALKVKALYLLPVYLSCRRDPDLKNLTLNDIVTYGNMTVYLAAGLKWAAINRFLSRVALYAVLFSIVRYLFKL